MYLRFHGDIIAGEQILASKLTQSSLKGLPQYTVVMATYSNHFKVTNMKRPKVLAKEPGDVVWLPRPFAERKGLASVVSKSRTTSQGFVRANQIAEARHVFNFS